jgi:hypothetical protein
MQYELIRVIGPYQGCRFLNSMSPTKDFSTRS